MNRAKRYQEVITPLNALASQITVGQPWVTYMPVLTASTTNPTRGPGALQRGRYVNIGKWVVTEICIAFGTSGTNAGSGVYSISLPIPALGETGSNLIGSGLLHAAGLYTHSTNILVAGTGLTTFSMRYINQAVGGTLVFVQHSTPGAWTTGDDMRALLIYEAS